MNGNCLSQCLTHKMLSTLKLQLWITIVSITVTFLLVIKEQLLKGLPFTTFLRSNLSHTIDEGKLWCLLMLTREGRVNFVFWEATTDHLAEIHSRVAQRSRAYFDVCVFNREICKDKKAIILLCKHLLKHSCQTSLQRMPSPLSDS